MDPVEIHKALAHPFRLAVLGWLKDPGAHFPPHVEVEGFERGVCVALIVGKSGLSQSTVSQYLAQLHRAGLVVPTRIGKWTYYRRDEDTIARFAEHVAAEL